MTLPNHDSDERECRLYAVLAAYVEATEAGSPPNRDEWLARNPDFRTELLTFFGMHHQIDDLTLSLRPMPCKPLVTLFDGYELNGEIGHGGMGVVYKARQLVANRVVALKVLRAGRFASDHVKRRFRHEIEAAGRLDHPRIVPIYEVGEHEGLPYFSMRYLEGQSLAIRACRPKSHREIAQIMVEIAHAIHHAHERGILHRDLKPSNILLDAEGRPHVADFGLAKDVTAEEALTDMGEIVGTPAYMAPEQTVGGGALVTISADVYGLGAILYFLLAGRPPFIGSDIMFILDSVRSIDPAPLRRTNAHVPRDLEAICLKCLEKDPARRYPSAEALACDLEAHLAGMPTVARPPGNWKRGLKWTRRHPTTVASLSTLALAVTVIISVAILFTLRLQEHNLSLQSAVNRAEAGEKRVRLEAYATQIVVADTLREGGQSSMITRVLKDSRPERDEDDPRGFEWHYLRALTKRLPLVLFAEHREWVNVQFIAGTATVASIGRDGIVKRWDAHDGKLLDRWTIPIGGERLDHAIFSADGSRVLCCSSGWSDARTTKELALWDFASKKCIARKVSRLQSYEPLSLTTNGGAVAFLEQVSNDEWIIRAWNTETDEPIALPVGLPHQPDHVALSKNGGFLALAHQKAGADKKIHTLVETWDAIAGKRKSQFQIPSGKANELVFSPNGKWLATASWGEGPSQIWLSKIEAGQTHLLYERSRGSVAHVAFSDDNKLLAIGSQLTTGGRGNESLILWNLEENRKELLSGTITDEVTNLSFAPGSNVLALGCTDGKVRLYPVIGSMGDSILSPGGQKEAWSVAFSPDSQLLAVGYDDEAGLNRETLKIWDVRTRKECANLVGHAAMVSQVTFLPSRSILASAGYDAVVKLWDAKTHQQTGTLTGPVSKLRCLATSHDGELLAAAGFENDVYVWDVKTRGLRHVLKGDEFMNKVAFSPDGTLFASAGFSGKIICWSVVTGERVKQFHDSSVINALCYSPDGQSLVTGNGEGVVKFWDIKSQKEIRSLLGHKGETRSIAFSVDGKTLATGGGDDGSVRLWQVATGRELIVFRNLRAKVNSLAFAPDGKYLAAALHDGTVRIWEACSKEQTEN